MAKVIGPTSVFSARLVLVLEPADCDGVEAYEPRDHARAKSTIGHDAEPPGLQNLVRSNALSKAVGTMGQRPSYPGMHRRGDSRSHQGNARGRS